MLGHLDIIDLITSTIRAAAYISSYISDAIARQLVALRPSPLLGTTKFLGAALQRFRSF